MLLLLLCSCVKPSLFKKFEIIFLIKHLSHLSQHKETERAIKAARLDVGMWCWFIPVIPSHAKYFFFFIEQLQKQTNSSPCALINSGSWCPVYTAGQITQITNQQRNTDLMANSGRRKTNRKAKVAGFHKHLTEFYCVENLFVVLPQCKYQFIFNVFF